MKNKYKNKKVEYNGIKFDSKKELARYKDLLLLQRAGEISGLILQPKVKFEVNGKPLKQMEKGSRQVTYTADFSYIKDNKRVWEDVKSPATAKAEAFKIKKALFETIYDKKLTLYI